MFKTNFSGHNIILGAQKSWGGNAPVWPSDYIRNVCYMNEIYTKLRHNLPSVCEIEMNRQNINPSCSKPEIVPYLCLLTNCVKAIFTHFHDVNYLFWHTFVTFGAM